jgi:hypothetical protein
MRLDSAECGTYKTVTARFWPWLEPFLHRCRANMVHTRQSRPNSGLGCPNVVHIRQSRPDSGRGLVQKRQPGQSLALAFRLKSASPFPSALGSGTSCKRAPEYEVQESPARQSPARAGVETEQLEREHA